MSRIAQQAEIRPRVAPALDAVDAASEVARPRRIVHPNVAVAVQAMGIVLGIGGGLPVEVGRANGEAAGAVDEFLECGGLAREAQDPFAPHGSDAGFADTGVDVAHDGVHKGCIARVVLSVRVRQTLWVWRICGDPGRECWREFRGADVVADAHAPVGKVAEEIPPFGLVGERGVCDACDEAWDFEEIIDFGEFGVREGVAGEASEDAARCEGAGSEDGFGDFAGPGFVADENDALLGEECVYQHDDWVGVWAICGEMWVDWGEWSRVLGVWDSEG